MKLLLILLHAGRDGITRNHLMENLYGSEELADSANNLRVTIHRLKKLLTDSGLPEYEYIVSRGGIYYWDSPVETIVDVDVFKALIRRAAGEESTKKKQELLQEACRMYSGEFLQKLSGDEWVLMESVQCKNLYTNALEQLCSLLMNQKEYEEVLRLAENACEMYPFDEWQAVKIECYIAMNRYKEALREYEVTARMLIDELGVAPSERMMKLFEQMSKQVSNRTRVISEIQDDLQENPELSGALFCTYPGFRDAYRVVRRGMERNGQSVFLMLCTLVDGSGRPMEGSERLDEMAEGLYESIRGSLRKCDSFTKYNRAQFLVMLVGTSEENCQIAINRIENRFGREHKNWKNHLECSVSSLRDVENESADHYIKKLF